MEIEEDLESLVIEEDLNEKEIELEDQPHNFKTNFKIYLEDLISLFSLYIPIMSNIGSDFTVGVIQLMFVGHIGTIEMSAAALGNSFCNVTGFSLNVGLLSAMDTLVSQAHGAKEMRKIGQVTNQSLLMLGLVTLLMCPVWMLSGPILRFLGQQEEIIELTALYIQVCWFGLYPGAVTSTMRRYLQNQNIKPPLIISGILALVVSTASTAILLYVVDIGFIAMPITQVITRTSTAIFLTAYPIYHGLWNQTKVPITRETFKGILTWVKLAIPGMFMVCSEWWGIEINILIAGTMDTIQIAAMTLMMTVLTFLYTFPLSMAITASTKVGNAIGSNNIPQAIRYARLCISSGFIIQSFFGVILILCQSWWPYIFTTDEDVIDVIIKILYLTTAFTLIDSIQTAIGGVLRGVGKQKIGAVTYIVSYYLVGLTVGITLAIHYGMGIAGQWIGTTLAAIINLSALGFYYLFILDWKKALIESLERLNSEKTPDDISDDIEIELDTIDEIQESEPKDNDIVV